MTETSHAPIGASLRPLAALTYQCVAFYFIIGMDWQWDTFDLLVLAEAAVFLLPALIRDVRAIHHNRVVRPQEIAWAVDRAARGQRRAMAQRWKASNR